MLIAYYCQELSQVKTQNSSLRNSLLARSTRLTVLQLPLLAKPEHVDAGYLCPTLYQRRNLRMEMFFVENSSKPCEVFLPCVSLAHRITPCRYNLPTLVQREGYVRMAHVLVSFHFAEGFLNALWKLS